MKKISITIPCYKAEETIEKLIDGIKKEFKTHKKYDYEIILVNDGSPDETLKVITKLAKSDNHIIALNLSKNFGESNALMAAYSKVTGDYVVRMDDDGEHKPEYLFKLIEKLEEGYDYVCADFIEYHHTLYKRIGSKFNYWFLAKMLNLPKDSIMSSYNVCRRYVIDEIKKHKNTEPYVDCLIWTVTNNIATVPVEHGYRYAGESGYNFKKSVELWLCGVTSVSIKPLRLASLLGCIFAITGFIVGLIAVIDKLLHPALDPGWTSIFSAIVFFSGCLLMFLGLIGEYVGRGYLMANNIPQFVIKEEIKKDNKNAKK